MFEKEEKSVSFKRRLSRVFRIINGLENGGYNVSLVAPCKQASSLTDYSLEAELKKAEALVYMRMVDRPK